MSIEAIKNLLLLATASFGGALILIIGTILTIGVGVLVFNAGWQRLRNFDMSGRIGGFYYARTPWRGYKRFRSQQWNMEHMP